MRAKRKRCLLSCWIVLLVIGYLSSSHGVSATRPWRIQAIEYPLPAGDRPQSLTTGADGNLWYTTGSVIGRLTPDGTVTTFPMPNNGRPDGSAAGLGPTNSGTDTRPDVPGPCGAATNPFRIVAGPDGNLWFTMCLRGTIGRITPAGIMTEFTLAASYSAPVDITTGPDGNLWFADEAVLAVGRLTLDGAVTRFPVPAVSGGFPSLRRLTAGPDGNLWLTHVYNPGIARITPSGQVTEFSLDLDWDLHGITTGSDGNLWFTATSTIGRITPCGVISGFALPVDWSQWLDDLTGFQFTVPV